MNKEGLKIKEEMKTGAKLKKEVDALVLQTKLESVDKLRIS